MEKYEEKIEKEGKNILDNFKKNLAGIRTSRPQSGLVENIKVNYYNQILPIKQLGTVNVRPPREIEINVWDKNATQLIAKAIESSDLKLSTNIVGNSIKIFLPELSQERRNELIKYSKKIAEECKIKIRHLRDELNKGVQLEFEEKKITEDDKFKIKEDIQKRIDKLNEEIEKLLENKIKEISE
jgi:ribosome recycling factor